MRFKRTAIVATGLLLLSTFTGCSRLEPRITFSGDVFLKYSSAPAGDCQIYELYQTNIEVSSDGTARLYCDDFEEASSDVYPTREIKLSEEEITTLKDAIIENDILSLPKDISTESCDGSFYYLTVYTGEGKHETGGLNVDNRRFRYLEGLLYDMVEEEWAALRDEVNDIQLHGFDSQGTD